VNGVDAKSLPEIIQMEKEPEEDEPGSAEGSDANCRRNGRSLVALAFSPSTTYGSTVPRRSKNPKAPRASADSGGQHLESLCLPVTGGSRF
jgi:hypothetical protein